MSISGKGCITMLTIDIESTGLDRFADNITLIGVQREDGKQRIYQAPFTDFVRDAQIWKSQKERFLWQNGKFDTLFIKQKLGIKLPISEDTLLLGTAYDLAAEHGLKKMAKNYLGVEDWDIGSKKKKTLSPELFSYLKKDLKYTRALYDFFMDSVTPEQLKIYRKLLRPAYRAYRNSEDKGIYIDREKLAEVTVKYKQEAARLHKELLHLYNINWNSSAQVSKVLFEQPPYGFGLPILKKTKKGVPSTEAAILRRLAVGDTKGSKVCATLLEYKEYFGGISKFLDSWKISSSYDGRIHPSFNLTNVVTGRTSCSNPNLQQVPRKKELRNLYTAQKGRTLIEADYSQLELRIAADYANEKEMIRIYNAADGDLHTETGRALTGRKDITKEERSRAKPVNFGFLYGMQAKKFSDYALNSYGVVVTDSEAKRFRELYFSKYPRLLIWHKEQEELCKQLGGVYNRFGRFRALPDIYSEDRMLRSSAARKAINTPVQGTGSELILLSVTELEKPLREFNAFSVGSIHDSILVDAPEKYAKEVAALMVEIMENPKGLITFGVSFKVPIVAEVKIGAWGS